MLQSDEAMAKPTLQRTEPSAIRLINEHHHGKAGALGSGDVHEEPPRDARENFVAVRRRRVGESGRDQRSRIDLDNRNMNLYRSHKMGHLSRKSVNVPTDKANGDSYLETKLHS
jgi:hypothetical protein